MGFGTELRKAQNVTLPLRRRQQALGRAIQFAQPIGFHATWSHLEVQTGLNWRAPDFLPIATDHLADERSRRRDAVEAYTAIRIAQKAQGMRTPERVTATAMWPARWHGNERAGAAATLRQWQRDRAWDRQDLEPHAVARPILQLTEQALTGASFDGAGLGELQRLLAWSTRQVFNIGWDADRDEYRRAWTVYRLLGQLHVLEFGAPELAVRLTFRSE